MTRDNFLATFAKTAGGYDALKGARAHWRPCVDFREVEHVTLQTGGSWGSEPGYYIGGEHTKPEPFYGWEGAQS